jgi:protein involved in polysaccharide export with SLBB domain
VTIILSEFSGQKVWVSGEVNGPGAVDLRGRMTALQAIFNAGGHRRSGKLESVIIFRRDDVRRETIAYMLDLERKLDGEPQPDFVLQPYDMVYVPKSAIAKIGDFVDMYINDLVPDFMRLGYNFTYAVNTDRSVDVISN